MSEKGFECSYCEVWLHRNRYSKTQFRKGRGRGRCKECVKFLQEELEEANMTNEALKEALASSGDSTIMSLVKSAIHKHVDILIYQKSEPFSNGMPADFCSEMSAAPTCMLMMSCRHHKASHPDNNSHPTAVERTIALRQLSNEMATEQNHAGFDSGESITAHCAKRLSDPAQILLLEAHGSTLGGRKPLYRINESNIFWVFPSVTGLALTDSQYSAALQSVDELLHRKLPHLDPMLQGRRGWVQFLINSNNGDGAMVKDALQKQTYRRFSGVSTHCALQGKGKIDCGSSERLSWRVYRPW